LLAAESLLFAATTVAIALSAGSTLGVRRVIPPFRLAVASTTILLVVAFGAATAWWDVYVHAWPNSFTGSAQAVCILVGILAQPLFAAAVALNVNSGA
jgi:hypothetical protein